MSLDPAVFETLIPSRFISFTLPNPFTTACHHRLLHTSLLRVAVLDSPTQPTNDPPRIAAMIVPNHRESDWIFSTFSGHLQLLLSCPQISRLILIGNLPGEPHHTSYNSPAPFDSALEQVFQPLVISLSPKLAFKTGYPFPQIPFLSYDDGVIRNVIVEICVGSCVGEILVEDVELEILSDSDCKMIEFRRRLRFKRTPNLVQTQIRISPNFDSCKNGHCVLDYPFSGLLDTALLVHPYLIPMAASVSLVSSHIEGKIQDGFRPKALCLGVGGGALLTFLNTQLGFEVVGVEADEAVLGLARRRFGLPVNPQIHVHIGDGIEWIKKLAGMKSGYCLENHDGLASEFDVIMVDLDSDDTGTGIMAPPLEFVEDSALFALKSVLSEVGIVVVNVIPASKLFYESLVENFKKVFDKLYEIDVENGENFVLIASTSPVGIASTSCENGFLKKLKLAISGAFMDSIRRI